MDKNNKSNLAGCCRKKCGKSGSSARRRGNKNHKVSEQEVKDLQLDIDRAKIAMADIEKINEEINNIQVIADNAD